jgi:hypothetical protein
MTILSFDRQRNGWQGNAKPLIYSFANFFDYLKKHEHLDNRDTHRERVLLVSV